MRAVFTVDLPALGSDGKPLDAGRLADTGDGCYPTEADVLGLVRSFGWEPVDIAKLSDEQAKQKNYHHLAEALFADMPELAVEEKGQVIFYGFLPSDQTKFVITRTVPGQIKFRLLHEVLPRLQSSTSRIMRQILNARLRGARLAVSDNRVVLYEKRLDHIIVHGRVVAKPLVEAIRSNTKDTFLTIVPALMFIPVTFFTFTESPTWHEWIDRLSTALFVTSLVSLLGLLTTYFDIRRNRTIVWDVADPSD